MKGYLELVKEVYYTGSKVYNHRTLKYCQKKFGLTRTYDVSREDFPLTTLRELPFKKIMAELIWYISGEDHIRDFQKHASFWDPWADDDGHVPSAYGLYWRHYPAERIYPVIGQDWIDDDNMVLHYYNGERCVDQLRSAIEALTYNPTSRRIVVTAWHPGNALVSSLPPCHDLFQFHYANGELHLQLYQRSNDLLIGTPFNVATYSGLLLLISESLGYKAGKFIHNMGDAHIYEDQMEAAEILIGREETGPVTIEKLPKGSILDLTYDDLDDFVLKDYNPHPRIKIPVSV